VLKQRITAKRFPSWSPLQDECLDGVWVNGWIALDALGVCGGVVSSKKRVFAGNLLVAAKARVAVYVDVRRPAIKANVCCMRTMHATNSKAAMHRENDIQLLCDWSYNALMEVSRKHKS
jgi:hypothetical protein